MRMTFMHRCGSCMGNVIINQRGDELTCDKKLVKYIHVTRKIDVCVYI
jgi:hypothetical protein